MNLESQEDAVVVFNDKMKEARDRVTGKSVKPIYPEYDENGDLHLDNNVILKNHGMILGELPDGSNINLIEVATYNAGTPEELTQVEVGSETVHMNINSSDRPTFEEISGKEEAAYVSDIPTT